MAIDFSPRTVSTGSHSSSAALTANFSDIETALQDAVSRSGVTPNSMSADLDMNSNQILNLPSATTNAEPLTYGQFLAFQENFREQWVSVTDFGATGNGVTDDTDAINEALSQISSETGGTLYFPAGTYITSSVIQIPSYVTLRGAVGKNVSKLVGTSDKIISNDAGSTNPATQHIGIHDLTIEGGDDTNYAIFLDGCQYSNFSNLYITGITKSTGYGIELTTVDIGGGSYVGSSMNSFYNIRIHNCYNGWHFTKNASDTGTDGANLNQVYSSHTTGYGDSGASSLTGIGTYVEYGEGNTFVGCRNLTGNDWTTAWQIQDSVNTLVGCASDGAIGGTAPDGSENIYGMPYGYDNNARGFYFTSTATGSILVNPLGNSPKERVTFEDQNTFETIFVLRHQFNWFGKARFYQIGVGNTFDASFYSGTGSPENNVTAKIGSVYLRTDGGTTSTFYVKESGSDNTGWVAK